MSDKPRKLNLPLTYPPKIEAVRRGCCDQTIRIGHDKRVGDLVSFHGWEGKPYRSKWSFRTPYWPLVEVIEVEVYHDGIAFPIRRGREGSWETVDGIAVPDDHWISPWSTLDSLAARDCIDPPTGVGLKAVLKSMLGGHIGCCGIDMQILRWDPSRVVT